MENIIAFVFVFILWVLAIIYFFRKMKLFKRVKNIFKFIKQKNFLNTHVVGNKSQYISPKVLSNCIIFAALLVGVAIFNIALFLSDREGVGFIVIMSIYICVFGWIVTMAMNNKRYSKNRLEKLYLIISIVFSVWIILGLSGGLIGIGIVLVAYSFLWVIPLSPLNHKKFETISPGLRSIGFVSCMSIFGLLVAWLFANMLFGGAGGFGLDMIIVPMIMLTGLSSGLIIGTSITKNSKARQLGLFA